MKTLKTVEIIPIFVEEMTDLYKINHIYISEKYNVSKHICLCGCEEMVVMPLDDGTKWWKLVKEKDGTISFIGSVGNFQYPCKSHYIITKNKANFV
jgi:hypothetical protein